MTSADEVYERRTAHLKRLAEPFDTESDKLAEWCDFVENEVAPPSTVEFSPSRFPWTYAADFLRSHSWMVPDEVVSEASRTTFDGAPSPRMYQEFCQQWSASRAGASRVRQVWARMLGLPDRDMATALAVAFCKENRIGIPAEILHGVDQSQPS